MAGRFQTLHRRSDGYDLSLLTIVSSRLHRRSDGYDLSLLTIVSSVCVCVCVYVCVCVCVCVCVYSIGKSQARVL